MQWMPFGKKHMKFIKQTEHARITFLSGSVRSGKTIAMLVKLLWYIKYGPPGLLLIIGVSKETVYDNVLRDLFETLGENNYHYNKGSGELTIGKRVLKVIGAKDQGSEKYIRGKTLAGAYVDEATLIPENFFKQLLNRNSIANAKIFCTTNPDTPYHYLYKEYVNDQAKIDSGMVEVINFDLDDNPNLSDEYKEFVRNAYSGAFYDRMILGRWVIAEGLIYDAFDKNVHIVKKQPQHIIQYYVGSDFGTQNPTTFILFGKSDEGKWYILKEYYYSGREEQKQLTTEDYVREYQKWIGDIPVKSIVIDPSASALKAAFTKFKVTNLRNAKNDVSEGINAVGNMLKNKELFVHESCVNTIKEFESYAWDDKAASRGEDKPIKTNDHAMDAIRYVVLTEIIKGIRKLEAIKLS